MTTSELQKAIDTLQIEDVYLRNLSATCAEGFDPKYSADPDRIQTEVKFLIKKSMVVELPDGSRLLRVFVEVGCRWVDAESADDSPVVLAAIEAQFVAEYGMQEALEQNAIDEFSLKNVSYHVGPYWHELLSSQCERMRLPRPALPAVQLANNRDVQLKNSPNG